MQSLHEEGEVQEIGAVALALFCQLLAPGTAPGEPDEEEKLRRSQAQSRAAVQRIKEIFGLAGDYPPVFTTPRPISGSGKTANRFHPRPKPRSPRVSKTLRKSQTPR